MLSDCYMVAMWLLWFCYVVAMWFLCGCYGVAMHINGVMIFANFIGYIFLFLSFYSLYFEIYCFVIFTRFVTDKLWKNLAPKNLAYIFDNNCHYPRYFLHFFLEPIFLTLIVISLYFLQFVLEPIFFYGLYFWHCM